MEMRKHDSKRKRKKRDLTDTLVIVSLQAVCAYEQEEDDEVLSGSRYIMSQV